MKTRLIKVLLNVVTVLTIVACGGSGSPGSTGLSGIGGSGFISSGSISGFGSVFVNGVEFETDDSTFDIEGESGTQDDLAIGMIVRVSGTINDDGISGVATGISFDDELQGPVFALTNLTPPDFDDVKRSFSVLGMTVVIDSATTAFDKSGDIPTSTTFDFSTIANNNNVEISGFFDSDGNLNATRVELKDVVFDETSVVEVKGTISSFNAGANTFNLGTLNVDASSADLDDLPDGLENGLYVEVKGTFSAGTITASKVEGKDEDFEDSDEFELEGLVTNYVNNGNFKIAGISINASGASFLPTTLVLEDGVRVEVEGEIVDGVLIAEEVELRGGAAKLRANVSSVDTTNNSFTVRPVAGQPVITVLVNSATKLEDDVNEIEPFALSDMVIGDYVEVVGFDDGNGKVSATEVKVKEAEDILVQGVIQSGSSAVAGIKIFGVTFMVDYPDETEFEGSNDNELTQTQFFNSVIIGATVIKVEDEDMNGIADEVEID